MKTMRVGEGRVKEGRAAKGIREVFEGSEKKENLQGDDDQDYIVFG